MTREEDDVRELFTARYTVPRQALHRDIERAVIGGDWGANGYTTAAQADLMAGELRLDAGSLLLDLGAGRGWPGLYLAASTGCSAVLTDLPVEGLRAARDRALAEGLAPRVWTVVGTAASPPLRPASFDAAVATDVLC